MRVPSRVTRRSTRKKTQAILARHARSKPKPKKPLTKKQPAATATAPPAATQFFRLFALPWEVRDKIYGNFKNVPKKEEADAEYIDAIKVTRRSLLSVSHEVSEEWSPIFHETACIRVDKATEAAKALQTSPTYMSLSSFDEGMDFGDMFLNNMGQWRLRNIRKLSCSVLQAGHRPSAPLMVFAKELPTFLDSLESLEEVEFYDDKCCNQLRTSDLGPTANKIAPEQVWDSLFDAENFPHDRRTWDRLENTLVHKTSTAVVGDWKIITECKIARDWKIIREIKAEVVQSFATGSWLTFYSRISVTLRHPDKEQNPISPRVVITINQRPGAELLHKEAVIPVEGSAISPAEDGKGDTCTVGGESGSTKG